MRERPLPTGTITFLFSDMEGSTRLVQDLGPAAYAELLERHNAVLREAFARHAGIERGTQGDSFLELFTEAPAAVAAAVAAQLALGAAAWPAHGGQIMVSDAPRGLVARSTPPQQRRRPRAAPSHLRRARRHVLHRDGRRLAVLEHARAREFDRSRLEFGLTAFRMARQGDDIGAATIALRDVEIHIHLVTHMREAAILDGRSTP